ncbi:kynurenine formamidase isoform X4 [Erythrolamprus reginae]|uniref:kynurenine formamidase isoform X4 n=1 Tax=Erythrolamprus reginae TaxID=121349 RepID=UPI00396CC8DA
MGKWQEMTKEELETQYSPSRWSPRLDKDVVIEAHIKAVTEGTRNAQAFTQTLLNVPYGFSEGEKLDVYLPKKHVESQLEVMVEQVRRSVAFAVQQYTGISGVYLLGHSAGAHLAAMVLSTDWAKFGVEPNIKGAFLVSGIYDLEPITHTYINDLLHMTCAVAQENSPLSCVPKVKDKKTCQVLIAVASTTHLSSTEQSQEYCQALRTAGWKVSLLDLGGTDHFDVIEKLSQENYLLTQVILNMISNG